MKSLPFIRRKKNVFHMHDSLRASCPEQCQSLYVIVHDRLVHVSHLLLKSQLVHLKLTWSKKWSHLLRNTLLPGCFLSSMETKLNLGFLPRHGLISFPTRPFSSPVEAGWKVYSFVFCFLILLVTLIPRGQVEIGVPSHCLKNCVVWLIIPLFIYWPTLTKTL